MLIDLIRADATISKYLQNSCNENGISVEIDPLISPENLVVVKVDNFYNGEVAKPDKSPDCLVIQRCAENTYTLYIIELKNIEGPSGFKVQDVKEKFITCLDNFMTTRYGNLFYDQKFEFAKIHLLFISDPYNFKKYPHKQEFIRGHKLDALMAQNIPKFFGKHLYIEPKVPNPTIRSCA